MVPARVSALRIRRGLFLAVLGPMLVSGCLDADVWFEARGEQAQVLPRFSYAYDGQGVRQVEGEVHLRLDDDADEARVRATVRDAAREHRVEWVATRSNATYMDGGVARNLDLHGSTGNGSAAYPRMHAYAAAWGRAEYHVNGDLQRDPTSGRYDFPARTVVVLGHVRDSESGMVWDALRSGPYDPSFPEDGSVDPQGAQILLEVRTSRDDVWAHFAFDEVRILRA